MASGPQRLGAMSLFTLATLLSACAGGSGATTTPPDTDGPAVNIDVGPVAVADADSGLGADWYTRGTFMEIYVRAFHDSNGDGIGDINGVTQKLDYLRDLGITGIWLMPITRTDNHDSGYIVTDYRSMETEYGTLEDVKTLIAEAHKRGIGVIMDYVANHSGDSSPLFINSRSSRSAAYRDWYVWEDDKPVGWSTWSGADPWHTSPVGAFYAVFWNRMPDFNMKNREVVEYHKNSLRFWLNLGVDGFRFDAVHLLVENGKDGYRDQPESMALMREFREVVNSYSKRYMVCENTDEPLEATSELGCKSGFAFHLSGKMRDLAKGNTSSLSEIANYPLHSPMARSATFLANHDRFAGLRLMNEFAGDEKTYRLAAATLLTYPGIPFLYYGEEIGMMNMPLSQFDSTSDWPLRGPMSWSATPSVTDNTRLGEFAGLDIFSTAPNAATHNVGLQQANPDSLMNFYRALLTLRKNSPALRAGNYSLINSGTSSLVFERRTSLERVLVALNYGKASQTLNLTQLAHSTQYSSALAYGATARTIATAADGSASLVLPPQSVQVFRTAVADEMPYAAPLFVRGDMNAWTAQPGQRLDYASDGRMEVVLELTEARRYQFVIGDEAGTLYSFGGITAAGAVSQALDVSAGQTVELEPVAWKDGGAGHAVQLDIAAPGRYRFVLDASIPLAPRLTVSRL